MDKKKRLGFIGIIIHNRLKSAHVVNDRLTEFGRIIMARMGVHNLRGQKGIITLVIDGTTDEVGALTGRIGSIPGVEVKSALFK